MDFALSDEQQMLVDASRELLQDRSGPAEVRASMQADATEARLWALGAELGWPALAIGEAHGGSAQGLVELTLVAEQLGRAVARGPFVPTMLAAATLSQVADTGPYADVLTALASGSISAAPALAEPGDDIHTIRATAQPEGDGYVIVGTRTLVQDAASASWLLVSANVGAAAGVFLVDRSAPGVTVRRQQTLDVTREFDQVVFERAQAIRLEGGRVDTQRLLDAAAVLTAADSLGAGARLLELTVEYAKVRFQFGRAIGSFQAVKHKCATMRIQLDATRAAVYYAAMAADADADDATRAASVAKAYASQAMSDLAGEALQVHGGIGFTWEHDLHLYLRRIKTNEVLYGDVATHERRVCELLVRDGAVSR